MLKMLAGTCAMSTPKALARFVAASIGPENALYLSPEQRVRIW